MGNLTKKYDELTSRTKQAIEALGEGCIFGASAMLTAHETFQEKFMVKLTMHAADNKSGIIKNSEIMRLLRNSLIEAADDAEEYMAYILKKEAEND